MRWFIFILLTQTIGITLVAQDFTKLKINPDFANGGKFSELFDTAIYVPLETNKESLFGSTNKLIITDSSYVIGDFDTKSVYFFSLHGKFIKKIKLPFDDRLLMDITYEDDKQRIAIRIFNFSSQRGDCKYYYLNGNALDISPATILSFQYVSQIYLGNGFNVIAENSYLNKGSRPVDSVSHMLQILNHDYKYNSFLPFIQSKQKLLSRLIGGYSLAWGHPIIVNNSSFYISEPLTHKVYKISKDSITPKFQFILPANRIIPQELIFNNNIRSIDSLVDLITFDNKLILQISKICYIDSYLYFKFMPKVFLSNLSSESEYQYNFLLSTNNKLISFERITPDINNFYLPVIGHTGKRDGFEIYKNKLYSSLSSLEMFNNYDKTFESLYPETLKQYFKNESRKSNPVIVIYKFRK